MLHWSFVCLISLILISTRLVLYCTALLGLILFHCTHAFQGLPCKRPTHKEMKTIKEDYLRKKNSFISESFNVLYKDGQTVFEPSTVGTSRKTMTFRFVDKRCPKYDYSNPCPHYYSLDVDDLRVPRMLVQAECRCSECLESEGFMIDQQRGIGCQKVYHYSLVMRAVGCSNGTMVYKEGLEPISVGCACKRQNRITMKH